MPAATAVSERRHRMSAEERRKNLIDATIETLARHGAQGASLRRVCQLEGVAPGLANHFFDGWHDMILTAYAALTDRFEQDLAGVLSKERNDPRKALHSAIDLHFSDRWLTSRNADAYIAIWSLSRTEVDLRARMTAHYGRTRGLLTGALETYADAANRHVDVSDLSDGFLIYLNGLWMEMILNPGHIDRDRAVALARQWLDRFVPENPNDRGQ